MIAAQTQDLRFEIEAKDQAIAALTAENESLTAEIARISKELSGIKAPKAPKAPKAAPAAELEAFPAQDPAAETENTQGAESATESTPAAETPAESEPGQ